LEAIADDSIFNDITRLGKNKNYGRAREMLVIALGKMKNSHAVPVLMDLLNDEEVTGQAVMALGKLRAIDVRVRIKKLRNPH